MLDRYVAQVRLLLDTLPDIANETVFALKGGTAINLFYRDMPRLSVDIDLTYLPVADRKSSLEDSPNDRACFTPVGLFLALGNVVLEKLHHVLSHGSHAAPCGQRPPAVDEVHGFSEGFFMGRPEGRIVNISSAAAWLGLPNHLYDIATKAAIVGMTRRRSGRCERRDGRGAPNKRAAHGQNQIARL